MAHNRFSSVQAKLSAVGLFGLLVTGCASVNPTEQVGAFAAATKAYTVEATEAYQDINHATTERRLADLAAENDPSTVGQRLADQKIFEPFLAGDALDIRLGYLRALGNYAEGLHDLSTAEFKKDIDGAAQE